MRTSIFDFAPYSFRTNFFDELIATIRDLINIKMANTSTTFIYSSNDKTAIVIIVLTNSEDE